MKSELQGTKVQHVVVGTSARELTSILAFSLTTRGGNWYDLPQVQSGCAHQWPHANGQTDWPRPQCNSQSPLVKEAMRHAKTRRTYNLVMRTLSSSCSLLAHSPTCTRRDHCVRQHTNAVESYHDPCFTIYRLPRDPVCPDARVLWPIRKKGVPISLSFKAGYQRCVADEISTVPAGN